HEGQVDKGGYPYCFHPIHLAEQMEEESECLIALLHDVVEDCPEYPLQRVVEEVGLNEEEEKALFLVTHVKSVPYREYCEGLSENRIARKVKIADLRHNLDRSRMNGVIQPSEPSMKEVLAMLLAKERES
ncbi:MAG: GTP pyrophosphokinase, partial [Bacilli bacterium]|nr:GTP pyrophosphokinase [Bacilli bacterium]